MVSVVYYSDCINSRYRAKVYRMWLHEQICNLFVFLSHKLSILTVLQIMRTNKYTTFIYLLRRIIITSNKSARTAKYLSSVVKTDASCFLNTFNLRRKTAFALTFKKVYSKFPFYTLWLKKCFLFLPSSSPFCCRADIFNYINNINSEKLCIRKRGSNTRMCYGQMSDTSIHDLSLTFIHMHVCVMG